MVAEHQTKPPRDDPDPGGREADLWFLPGPLEEDEAGRDLPWAVAAREESLDAAAWRGAEREAYRALLAAAQPLARLGERLRHQPGATERLALESVAEVLRSEGVWLGLEKIALFRALRLSGAEADARSLGRAAWAVRRLLAEGQGRAPQADLRAFLGRQAVAAPDPMAAEDRAVGGDLDALGPRLGEVMALLADCHPLTRGACAYAWWRGEGVTPWADLLEPTVAAMRIGAEGLAPFLPMTGQGRLDRPARAGGAAARIAAFCAAAEQGALAALMTLDRLERWTERGSAATRDLSGRTPPLLLAMLGRLPLVSAELVAAQTGCSTMSARRNLSLLVERGLAREVTGQARYRFWAARL